jgi:hypothetical protein
MSDGDKRQCVEALATLGTLAGVTGPLSDTQKQWAGTAIARLTAAVETALAAGEPVPDELWRACPETLRGSALAGLSAVLSATMLRP